MKKIFTTIYTVFVIVALLVLVGWTVLSGRSMLNARIAMVQPLVETWTNEMSRSIAQDRNIEKEKELARSFLIQEPRLEVVQLYSHDSGLRLSVVSTRENALAENLANTALINSNVFNRPLMKLRFTTATQALNIEGMPGLDADFVFQVLGPAELRELLRIDLIVVVSLFLVTLLMILISAQLSTDAVRKEQYISELDENSFSDLPPEDEEKQDLDSEDEELFVPTDLDADSPMAENKISMEDFPESILDEAGDEFIGNFDEQKSDSMVDTLAVELERTTLADQDLSLILIQNTEELTAQEYDDFSAYIHDQFTTQDLIFDYEGRGFALIQPNVNQDEAITLIEKFLRGWREKNGNTKAIVGVASRNNRQLEPDRLVREAQSSLDRSDSEKNIVAFQSDSMKFKKYMEGQER